MSSIDFIVNRERYRLNRPHFFRPSWVCILLFLSTGLAIIKAHGETIIIGGGPGSLAWEEQFSEVSVIDFETDPGQIQPIQNSPEDNIALKILERGGSVTSPNARIVLEISDAESIVLLNHMISGDRSRAFEVKGINAVGIIIDIDLGQRFAVNRLRFFTRENFEDFFLKGYEISLNDGTEEQRTLAGTPDFRLFKTVGRNTKPIVEENIPLQFVRFIKMKQLVRGEWEIDEIEIFGEGFASEASYTSKVFDQKQPAVFGGIRWTGGNIGEPTKAGVTLSTRSGTSPDPSDLSAWSNWSPPYPSGLSTTIESPAPRQYFQFRFQFTSGDIFSAATVDSLEFELSPALADSVLGEVWPQNAFIGQDTTFTYAVKSFGSRGFDHLQIETLAPVDVVRSVEIDGTEVDIDFENTEDGLQINFPRIVGDSTLRVEFDSIALQYNTVFSGKVFDSTKSNNLPQVVVAGDAVPQADGDDLSVTILVGKNLLHSMNVASAITPNGDGVNDEIRITYDIVNLTHTAPISISVYDLAGRLVKKIYSGTDTSGRYQQVWDGTNDSGEQIIPGIYLVHLEIEADSGTEGKMAIVSLVY